MNWVPVKLESKEKDDIEFVSRKKQIVLMDSIKDSLSILTLPYPASGGTRMTVDFFGDDSQLLLQHIQEHFSHLRSAETNKGNHQRAASRTRCPRSVPDCCPQCQDDGELHGGGGGAGTWAIPSSSWICEKRPLQDVHL